MDIMGYQSGEEMIHAKGNFEIYFLDIEMGKMSGMDIARLIREQEESVRQRSIIIFVTGYREYMEAAFDKLSLTYRFPQVITMCFRQRTDLLTFSELDDNTLLLKAETANAWGDLVTIEMPYEIFGRQLKVSILGKDLML